VTPAALSSALRETLLWLTVREAALAGLRDMIAVEVRGIEIDRTLEVDTAPREQRLAELREALEMAEEWSAALHPPRRGAARPVTRATAEPAPVDPAALPVAVARVRKAK
jgi:hypothetical protein